MTFTATRCSAANIRLLPRTAWCVQRTGTASCPNTQEVGTATSSGRPPGPCVYEGSFRDEMERFRELVENGR